MNISSLKKHEKWKIAEDKKTTSEILEKLANDSDYTVRSRVATNRNVARKVLIHLANDVERIVRVNAIQNPALPLKILTNLSEDEDEYVRSRVAASNRLPKEKLEILSEDDDENVRESVAGNINTPHPILRNLAIDLDPNIRLAVAGNTNTPIDLFSHLGRDRNPGVRYFVSTNPSVPVNILMDLINDESISISSRKDYLKSDKINVDNLITLSQSNDHRIRAFIAKHPLTSDRILRELLLDSKSEVRLSLVRNTNITNEILDILLQDKDDRIRLSAEKKKNALAKKKRKGKNTKKVSKKNKSFQKVSDVKNGIKPLPDHGREFLKNIQRLLSKGANTSDGKHFFRMKLKGRVERNPESIIVAWVENKSHKIVKDLADNKMITIQNDIRLVSAFCRYDGTSIDIYIDNLALIYKEGKYWVIPMVKETQFSPNNDKWITSKDKGIKEIRVILFEL